MTSCYVIASSKLCPEVGDDYTTLCNFGGRSSVARAALFKAIERGGGGGTGGGPPPPGRPPPPQPVTGSTRSERKLGLNIKSLISLAQAMVY